MGFIWISYFHLFSKPNSWLTLPGWFEQVSSRVPLMEGIMGSKQSTTYLPVGWDGRREDTLRVWEALSWVDAQSKPRMFRLHAIWVYSPYHQIAFYFFGVEPLLRNNTFWWCCLTCCPFCLFLIFRIEFQKFTLIACLVGQGNQISLQVRDALPKDKGSIIHCCLGEMLPRCWRESKIWQCRTITMTERKRNHNAGSLNQEIQRGRLWNKIKAMPDVTTAWNSTPRMHCWEVTRCGEHEAALARDKVYVQKLLKEDQISVISAPFTENDHRLLVLPCGIKTIRWCWGWNRRALPRAGKRMRTAWPVSRRWMDTGPALRQRLSKMQPLWNHDMWLQ